VTSEYVTENMALLTADIKVVLQHLRVNVFFSGGYQATSIPLSTPYT